MVSISRAQLAFEVREFLSRYNIKIESKEPVPLEWTKEAIILLHKVHAQNVQDAAATRPIIDQKPDAMQPNG